MSAIFNGWLSTYFGNSIYTPSDLANDGAWPSMQLLASRGKTFIVNTNHNTFGEVYVHPDLRGFIWPDSEVIYFTGYPSCTSSSPTYTYANLNVGFDFFQEDLSVIIFDGYLVYNGTVSTGAFNNASTVATMECEFTTFFDYISSNSAQKLVWSWDFNQPEAHACGSISPTTGRWKAEDCFTVSHFFACCSNTNTSAWVIGSSSSERDTYDPTKVCPAGFSFSTPRTALENLYLFQQLRTAGASANVWISMNQYINGTWSDVATKDLATLEVSTSTTSDPVQSPASTLSPMKVSLLLLFAAVQLILCK